MVFCENSITMRGVLVTMVGVQEQSFCEVFLFFGELKSAQDQPERVCPPQLVRDDESIEEILDGGQICPATSGGNIGNIGDPFLVGLAGTKLLVE